MGAKKKKALVQALPAPTQIKAKINKPKTVLAEFETLSRRPLNLRSLETPCGPKIAGYTCMASWSVQLTDHEVMQYLEVSEQIGNSRILFHGTSSTNIESITSAGLRKGRAACMFGAGIYFGMPAKAIGYARAWRIGLKYMFEAEVSLGVCHTPLRASPFSASSLAQRGYHSIHARASRTQSWSPGTHLNHDEWVVYNSRQVYLKFVHEYQVYGISEVGSPVKSNNCMAAVTQATPLSGQKISPAWSDLTHKIRQCNVATYTPVPTNHGVVWICEGCIRSQRVVEGGIVKVAVKSRMYAEPNESKDYRVLTR